MTKLPKSNSNFDGERKFPLSIAAKLTFDANGVRPPSRATLCRWIRKGKLGIKLECRRFNGNYLTSVEAIERFIDSVDNVADSRNKKDTRRKNELDHVSKLLDDLGI